MNIFFETIGRLFFIIPSIPKTIQIEITNRCNLDCKMCPRKFLKIEYRDMNFELFKKIADRLSKVSEVILTGWGEPLIHSEIDRIIKYCSVLGLKTKLTTNGTLLNDEMAQKIISAGLNELTFSIDSLDFSNQLAHHDNLQIENIKSFSKKEKRSALILQTTIHKNKEEDIFKIIRFGKEIKAKEVNLVRLDIRFNSNLQRPNFEEEKRIVKEAVKLGDRLGVNVSCFHHSLGRGLFRGIFKLFKNNLHLRGKYCLKLYNNAYINLNGELTPCCNLPNYRIGSILEQPLSALWKNEKFRLFRKNKKSVCKNCDAGKIKQN